MFYTLQLAQTVNISDKSKRKIHSGVQDERRETDQARDGDGGPVGPAHEEPPQNDLVEGSIRAAGQEPVQL